MQALSPALHEATAGSGVGWGYSPLSVPFAVSPLIFILSAKNT